MDRRESIRAKLNQIEKLVAEVKSELDALPGPAAASRSAATEDPIPTEDELRREYDQLYDGFAAGNRGLIEEFVGGKSMKYLKAFCKANSLPVDTTKVGKKGITKELLQWMAQREALTRKVT